MSEISKAYEPQSVEAKWYQFWLDHNCFTADPARVSEKRPAYSIVIPPPNVTGVLTLGHVLNNTIQDILARRARMDGKEVLWLPGTDHAGIATQNVVEKTLKKAGEIKHRNDLGREALVAKIWEWKEKYGGIILQQLKALGASCDWTRTRFTMDPEYSRCVTRVFVDLYKKGLIYRGKRMVNWCPASLTALSDEEVIMKEQKGFMYHFKVEVVESIPAGSSGRESAQTSDQSRLTSAATADGKKVHGPVTDANGRTWLTIATTRPETIPADTAVAVNPKDPRYTHLIGKHVYRALPLDVPKEQRVIPIIADEHVDFEFGTGVLKVTPAHDKADFEIGLRHKLPVIDVLTPDGKMTAEAGADLAGLDRFAARKKAAEIMEAAGSLEKAEPYTNNVGFSERADVPIEPRLSEQWFLKYPSVKESRRCVAQPEGSYATNLLEKSVRVVQATGKEFSGKSIQALRKAALAYARKNKILGVPFKNEDLGIKIRVGRQSLSHAFSNIGAANIQAVAVLPELIRTAIWVSSEPHDPPNPIFKRVYRFIAALSIAGELHGVLITAKQFADGSVLYDHKVKKITSGGKSLEAHLPKEKLDTQPTPDACVKVSDLLEVVNEVEKMQFYPQRWAKVYDHWMTGIQDWCISRQLWWGHRIPVWTKRTNMREEANWHMPIQRAVDVIFEHADEGWEESMSGHAESKTWFRVERYNLDTKDFEIHAATMSDAEAKLLEEHGFTQDPDVLDTWFSSWLWPFATMGWPASTDTLKKFYPTTDLVTGPDIIFFWVARMIMAGYEYMGEMPFRNVYFTGIIRDKLGRKMSKSLGNSPDPLDLINKYGADALRFGIMRSAPQGQDLLFDEQSVELGRNFCNKLWNACRFRQMQSNAECGVQSAESGEGSADNSAFRIPHSEFEGEIRPELLTSDDKWILLKLDAAIREVTDALNSYKFNEAANALYRFFWSEYCDWYVEATKAVLQAPVESLHRDSLHRENATAGADVTLPRSNDVTSARAKARRENTLAVIDFVLSNTLRLFHPFLPFITEELWQGMGFNKDLPKDQGGETIMFARWPKPFDTDFKDHYAIDDCYMERVENKYEVVRVGRNLRREGRIAANVKVKFVLKPLNDLPPHDIEVMKLLLNAESLEVNAEYQPPKAALRGASPLGELYLPLEGLVDVAAEKARLEKELAKIASEVEKVQQKLANPNFTQKVPPQVLREHEQRLADWQSKHAQVKAALDALG